MTEPRKPEKAKLFAGVLACSQELLPEVKEKLENHFGNVDFESDTMPFDSTDYYESQMGKDLIRKFYAFEKLAEQDALVHAKLAANGIEKEFTGNFGVQRPVNIDPGVLLSSRIILASCKDFSHRIYLGDGVFGEVTLQYVRGEFKTLPWTFPDYTKKEYHNFFEALRQLYTEQLRAQR